MDASPVDHYTDRGETFVFRGGVWTTKKGMCVSTTRGSELTMKFYQRHGRPPLDHDAPLPKRAPTRKRRTARQTAKERVLRAAIARSLAHGDEG